MLEGWVLVPVECSYLSCSLCSFQASFDILTIVYIHFLSVGYRERAWHPFFMSLAIHLPPNVGWFKSLLWAIGYIVKVNKITSLTLTFKKKSRRKSVSWITTSALTFSNGCPSVSARAFHLYSSACVFLPVFLHLLFPLHLDLLFLFHPHFFVVVVLQEARQLKREKKR